MKNKTLKNLSVLLSILIIASTVAGCGSESKGKEDESKNSNSAIDKTPTNSTVEIKATYSSFGGIPPESQVGQAWHKSMEEKLGVTLDWNFIPYAEYAEKSNVLLATGDISDLHFIMDKKLVAPYEEDGLFVKLNNHIDNLPNYKAYLEDVDYGFEKISNGDGDYFGFYGGGIPRLDEGLGIYTNPVYRYDIFEENDIKIPETTDELIDAAKQLKELYPDSYPVSVLDWADTSANIFKTSKTTMYDGEKYVFGPMTENYKDMLKFKNQLYVSKLLDPESFTEDADTHNRKALNGQYFISLGEWFQQAATWTNNEESDSVWVGAFAPSDDKYGAAYQGVDNVNDKTIGSEGTYINANAENIDILLKLCDEQYSDETIRLITWGIEDVTYTLKEDGNPTFVDSIKNAQNPWDEGDKYGMRASSKFRPGLQGPIDTKAFIDFAPNDNIYIDGEFVEAPQETAFPDLEWPTSEIISPALFTPPVAFTPDESQNNANTMTAIETYVAEESMKFIKGERSFDDFDTFVSDIEDMGISEVIGLHNEKLAAFKK